jgi:MFS transporter, DHA1 family, multidrug resistance protein
VQAVPSKQPSLWLLVLITFSGTLAMHMFVPALPIAAHDLGVSVPAMQAMISLYIVRLALGQLVHGPFSDCFSHQPVLIAGITPNIAKVRIEARPALQHSHAKVR